MEPGEVPDARQETVLQRDDRNLSELIQELRVAGLGVQVLFGFLLSLPFTVRFTELSGGQRGLYLTSVVLAAGYRSRCQTNSQIMQPMSTGKCRPA